MTKTVSDFATWNSATETYEAVDGGVKYTCDRSLSGNTHTLGLGGTSITNGDTPTIDNPITHGQNTSSL